MAEIIQSSASQLGLSEQEVRGLSRIVLAIHSRIPHETAKEYDEKLCSLKNLIPLVSAVQVGYDSSGSRRDTSPLTLHAKVAELNPRRVILDTRFARDSWEGMSTDLIDYTKEFGHKQMAIRSLEIETRKVKRGEQKFMLRIPDELTVDVDLKTSHELASRTAGAVQARHSTFAAVVGTSRKPNSEYAVDPAEYSCDLIEMLGEAGLKNFRAITGVHKVGFVVDSCLDTGVTVSCTGAFLPEYDLTGEYRHPGGVDLREVADVDTTFIVGSPILAARSPYEALLAHATVLGD